MKKSYEQHVLLMTNILSYLTRLNWIHLDLIRLLFCFFSYCYTHTQVDDEKNWKKNGIPNFSKTRNSNFFHHIVCVYHIALIFIIITYKSLFKTLKIGQGYFKFKFDATYMNQ